MKVIPTIFGIHFRINVILRLRCSPAAEVKGRQRQYRQRLNGEVWFIGWVYNAQYAQHRLILISITHICEISNKVRGM